MLKKSIAIISNTDAGLLLAALLENDGHKITLIDTGNNFQLARRVNHHSVPFYPATPEFQASLSVLSSLFTEPLVDQALDLPPLTLQEASFIPFVGFGDSKSPATRPLTQYNLTQRSMLFSPFAEKLLTIRENFKGTILNYSELSRLEVSGSAVEKLVINGTQNILADHYIFMNSPRELMSLLTVDEIGMRTRNRVAKTAVWSRVALELAHEAPLFDGQNLIFLTPNQTDHDPCVGQFLMELTPAGPRYSSVWETYITAEYSEEAEHVSGVIKAIKKLIRRNFSHLEQKPQEILSITTEAAGDFAWLSEDKDIRTCADNLLISPTLAAPNMGFAQRISSAAMTYELFSQRVANPAPDQTTSLLERQS